MTTLQERARHAYEEQRQREEAKRQAARDLEAFQLRRLVRATLEMPDDAPEIVWLPNGHIQIDGLEFGVDQDKQTWYFLVLHRQCEGCGKRLTSPVYALEQLSPNLQALKYCIRCPKLSAQVQAAQVAETDVETPAQDRDQ